MAKKIYTKRFHLLKMRSNNFNMKVKNLNTHFEIETKTPLQYFF